MIHFRDCLDRKHKSLMNISEFTSFRFTVYWWTKNIEIELTVHLHVSISVGRKFWHGVARFTYLSSPRCDYLPAASSNSSCKKEGIKGSVSLKKFFKTVATALTWISKILISWQGSETCKARSLNRYRNFIITRWQIHTSNRYNHNIRGKKYKIHQHDAHHL